jgi:HK97 gp10 family phage protein
MLRITATRSGPGFRGYIGRVKAAAEEGPEEAAQYLADQWRQHVPVDTGSYSDSIYVATHDHSEYAEAVADAEADNPRVEIVPEVARPGRKGAAAVGAAAAHALLVEYGTSRMPARPAFRPALEATKREYPAILRRKLEPR